jgi:ankyrin repeat domain-containing protein 50
MVDPIGIVGTAVGIASFGLQLCGAITTYFDALESRGDDLKSSKAQLETLQSSLVVIEATIQPMKTTFLVDTSALEKILLSCNTELQRLESLLQTLVGSPTPVSSLRERMKALSFPLHRPTLIKLEERLQRTNGAIHTAICALQL